MDNENMIPEEEGAVMTDEEVAAFDEVFNDTVVEDDDFDLSEDPAEPEQRDDSAEPAEETKPSAEPEEKPEEAETPEPEVKPEAENQRFKLNYNGEEFEVDRNEVIALAQKGKDYDRVKEERDKMRESEATIRRYKEQDSFLKELAEESEITVEELMEQTRARMLQARDETLSEEEALAKVRASAKKQKPAEKKEEEKAPEPTPEERRQEMFANFIRAYPDVEADSIPKEVWDTAGRTFDLVGAYRDHTIRELRKEVETLRQNKKNKERSTGSLRSVGATAPKDSFDEGWDSE